MPFNYVVYTPDKEILTGVLDVNSQSLAEENLESSGYRIISLKEMRRKSSLEELFPSVFGVKLQHILEFSEQLAIMIGAGISLPTALQMIEEQTPSTTFKGVIAGINRELREGTSFSQALTKYPKVFPDIYCKIVRAGEQSGNLEDALMQAITYMQRGSAVLKEVQRLMIYPCFIIALAIAVVVLLITVAMPPLMGLFEDLGADLPWTTKLLLATTGFIMDYTIHILGALLAFVALMIWYLRMPAGRAALDRILLRIPAIRTVIIQSHMALFSRITSILLSTGMHLPQILDVVHQTASNRVIRGAMRDVQQAIYDGQGLAKPMSRNSLFPSLLVQMVNVGEKTGTLEQNLARLADYYESEVNKRIKALVSLLEPAITVSLGLGVGFIALSLIMPMYSMMGSIE